ncbi:unnamed protein product [Orchesella dallaii]|uniref:Nuclear respiratory factor 1 NLS/DNA-binding dimerisation domain-containing protein n=1 Tax=Orchesella dallaii TaxID=48710 RepID=A0ABP1Q4E7_9HEXA
MVTMNGEESAAIMPAAAPNLDHTLDDDDDDGMSDGSSHPYDENDLMNATMEDEVTAQLAAAGPVGMAAAAAIASAKKRKRPHQFETNPSIRKRQQTRLLRKLRQTIDEFTIRVGMQAVVLVAIPGKPQNSFKCFGAKPLEDVIRNLRPAIIQDLESSLAQHAPAPAPEDPTLHELPPLVIDGIPTPVEKMTQAQLRAFIPLMLKYSTGRGKPGWGKESTRPPWWPQDLPWANVRMDARTEDEKQKVSWTHALRQIVINCYKYHGREDLLPVFSADAEETDTKPQVAKLPKASPSIVTSTNSTGNTSSANQNQSQSIPSQALPYGVVGAAQVAQFQPTVLQTISNPDGSVSIIQVDPTNSIITLPDGTTAQVQGVATLQHSSDGGQTVQAVQTLADVTGHHHDGSNEMPVAVDLNSVAQAALTQEGQIILTGEDGHAYPVTVSGMITVPMPHNMYQTVVANISQIQAQQGADGTLQRRSLVHPKCKATYEMENSYPYMRPKMDPDKCRHVMAPMVMPKVEPGTEGEQSPITTIPLSVLTGDPSQSQLVAVNANGQVVHNDKIYQICEYTKPDSNEKVIMMAEVSNTHHDHSQLENGIVQHHQNQGQATQVISISQNDGSVQQRLEAKDNSNKVTS